LTLWVTPEATVVHEAHASTRKLGSTRKRQYLGSIVRMLGDTEPPFKLWLFRVVVFSQHLPIWLLRRAGEPGVRELWRALAGDVGPLPAAGPPTRNHAQSMP
jgi:hypothetical protein